MVEQIVSFSNPPVVEVSVGVSFPDLGSAGVAAGSGFWRDVASAEYPELQYQPPYEPQIERFTEGEPSFPQIKMVAGYPSPRLWAVASDGQTLLQLQSNWFACNWRRVRPQDSYDRWGKRRQAFEDWFTRYKGYIHESGLRVDALTQCEVTYINHIRPNNVFRSHRDFSRVFTMSMPENLGEVEQVAQDLKIRLTDADGVPRGRLHVSIVPAFDGEGMPMYACQLVARGAPQSADQLLPFLDMCRAQIDLTFVSLTSADIQSEWGRRK